MRWVIRHRFWLAVLLPVLSSHFCPTSWPAVEEVPYGAVAAIRTADLGTPAAGTAANGAEAIHAADVLILNSYHPGYPWSDGEQKGILEVFAKADEAAEPSIEYLDCKRFPETEKAAWLHSYLRTKYAARRFKLLILMDNPALSVGLAVRDEIFPGAAVVFCGVNGYRPELLAGRPRVTGVTEMLDAATTVDVALRLHPRVREVVAVSDSTVTGLATRRELEDVLPRFAGRASFRFTANLPIEALARQLAALPPDRLVVLLSYATDRNGVVFSHAASTRLLCASCPVPVYAVHELRLGYGIVGGSLLDGRLHGARAAEMALRILRGEDVARIPVELNSTSRLMFDHRQLVRFGIPRSGVGAGSIVINQPEGLYHTHRNLILGVAMALVVLTIATLVLVGNILRRRMVERALREGEERYRALFQSSADALFVLDADGRIRDANDVVVQRYGYSRAELLDVLVPDLSVLSMQAGVPDRLRQALQRAIQFESIHRRKDGTEFPVEVSARPITLGGRPFAFSTARDVTKRKEAEAVLRDLTLRQEAILASVPDIIAQTDARKVYTWLNPAGLHFLGEDAIGKEASFYFDGEQDTYQIVQPLFRGDEDVIYVESWQRRQDGERRLLAWWCRVTKDEHGNVTGALSTGRDITALKLVERELRERGEELARANEALRLSVQAGNVGLWDWDLQTNQVRYSPEWKRQIGYEDHEIGNDLREWEHRVHPDDLEDTLARIRAYRENPGPGYEVEFRFRHRNGSYLWILTRGSAVCDEDGRPVRLLGSHVDITERKQAEAERERLLRKLESKNHELESVLYAASHDLRAPLVNIQGFSKEIENTWRETESPEREDALDSAMHYIRSSVRKMDALIEGMLKVSRTGRTPLHLEPLDVARILEDVTASLFYQIQSAAAEVTIEPLPDCLGDANQINQAFTNLVDNALKYRDPGRPLRITVSGKAKDREVTYCVEDNGSGIPPKEQPRIWELFHRLDPHGDVEGEGVGLTLVQKIAERHNGRVTVESEPGKGSRFYLALPRAGS
jgi:PAS domain S-box-containing protein